MMTSGNALANRGIHLREHHHGEHRAACPECARTRPRRGDTALAVRIDPDGSACWLCHRCGWVGATKSGKTAPSQQFGWRRPSPPEAPPDLAPERKRLLAQETWRQTEAIADGLPFAYLTQCRGIRRWDGDRIRWHPSCPAKLAEDGTVLRRAGCIVCPVSDHATGYVTAIWCIRPVMAGKVPRWGLGPVKGNGARLFWTRGPQLIIAEGVEDALAAHALFGGMPAWAALSAGNMAKLILPPGIQQVLILADRDEPKQDGHQVGLQAAHDLAQRLRHEGRIIAVRWSRIGKDANDALRGTAA
jgi:putative DNA primase/helicase